MKKIILRIGREPGGITWAETADNGPVACFSGTLQDAAARINDHRVILLVPAAEVALLTASVPSRNAKQIARAIPFALEESLAVEVEKQHFAQGKGKNGLIPVAVVSAETLAGWLRLTKEAGIEPHYITPESLALPLHTDSWSILCDGALAIVRTETQQGFALETENLALLLADNPEQKTPKIMLYGSPHAAQTASFAKTDTVHIIREPSQAMEVLAQGFAEETAINLLQGSFSPNTMMHRIWKQWRASIILLAAALLIFMSMMVGEYVQLKKESRELNTAIEAVFRDTFPDAKKIVNPRVQMEHQLQAMRSSSSSGNNFIAILQAVSPVLLSAEGFSMQSLKYKDGRLDLDFILATLKSLDELKSRMGQAGLQAEIQTASSRNDKIRTRMQVQAR